MTANTEKLGITHADIEQALEVVENSTRFKKSAKAKALLHYVVQQHLQDKADQIKAYTIGVDALGKQENYDPQTDPTVRVLASRLRSMLELYYSDEGINDPIIITIPSGGYKPKFDLNAHCKTEESEEKPAKKKRDFKYPLLHINRWAFIILALLSSIWLYRSSEESSTNASINLETPHLNDVRILVRPIDSEIQNTLLPVPPHRLYFNLLEALSNNNHIMPVIAPGSITTIQQFMANNSSLPGPSHMLVGELVAYGEKINFTIKLIDFPSMNLVAIKSYSYDQAAENIKTITDEIANIAISHKNATEKH